MTIKARVQSGRLVVDEPTTKLAALTSGELDFAGINPAHAEFVRKNPDLAVLDYPLLFTYAVVLNTRRPPFDRFLVRRALTLPVNREAIVDGVLFGYGTPAGGPLPPPMAPEDEAKAADLVKKAGVELQ